ncbi:MAG: class I SAM-dependent methyltransferase, partial [Gemmataceae bacterium]
MKLSQSPARPAIRWEEVPCPLCGHPDSHPCIEAIDPAPRQEPGLVFGVVQCRMCQMRFTNPRPDRDSIGHFYPEDYKPHRRPTQLRYAQQKSIWARWTGRDCPERQGLLPWPEPGRLLDFGCGGGSFLERMAAQGWDVTGLDAAVGAVQSIQSQLGLKALEGTLPHPDLRPGSFDVITMWHSLEHVHDPREILAAAYELLIPGGKLIIACPNIESLP